MRFAFTVSALAFAAVALAQDQTIKVGEVDATMVLAFSPASITATKGSIITFVFDGFPGNHTVAQSTFASPCTPMPGGFDSGFFDTAAPNGPAFGIWNLTITDDTKPIWFYCSQVNPKTHCNAGMVGAINAPTTGNTFDLFLSNAKSLPSASILQPTPTLVGDGAFATSLFTASDASTAVTSAAPSSLSTVTITTTARSISTVLVTVSSSTGTASITGPSRSTSPSMSTAADATDTGSGAAAVGVNGVVAVIAAAFGFALL